MTAAHRTLPFGTQIRVTNLRNNRQVTVRVNDRGPFTGGRILDLSAGAARAIGLDRAGVGPVRIEVLAN
ncbi:MAG: septal ring lytic transglycosylase RlpA family protein, partial [Cyanobacteria bacterium P01_H01_bin.58]